MLSLQNSELLSKKNIQVAVIIGGCIVILFLLKDNFIKKGPSAPAAVSQAGGRTEITQLFSDFDGYVKLLADKEVNDQLERIMQKKLHEGWERNPFAIQVRTTKESVEEETGVPEFNVSGIVAGKNIEDSTVIIDGDLYRLGDVVRGWTIAEIRAETITFTREGTEYIHHLYTEEQMGIKSGSEI